MTKIALRTTKKLLSVREVCAKTSLSRSTIWKRINAGAFPRPIKLGDDGIRTAFLESEIDQWIDDLIASRDEAAA
jgi:prophage regulatory protein